MAMSAAKKRSSSAENEPAQGDSFVVLFTALMMILLAFFILLNSLSTIDERRKRMAIGSILGSFGIMPSGQGYDHKGEFAPKTSPIMGGVRQEVFLRVLGRIFSGFAAANQVRIFTRGGEVILSFRSDILFPSGVSDVSPAAFGLLDQVASVVFLFRHAIRIEGHADSSPGLRQVDNWRVSTQRAISVLRYLKDVCRVPAELMTVAGYSDTRPADEALKANGEKHRRVEIVFTGHMETASE